MNFENAPIYVLMPPIPDDARPYFIACMAIFTIWFYFGMNWWLAKQRDGMPPNWYCVLKDRLGQYYAKNKEK